MGETTPTPAVEVGRRVKVLQPAPFYNHHGTVTEHDPDGGQRPWLVGIGPGMAGAYAADQLRVIR